MTSRSTWLRGSALCLVLWLAGCAAVPPARPIDYGSYPADREGIVEQYLHAHPSPDPNVTVTVSSVTEPVRQVWDDIAGWGVWVRVRETRPNAAGGVEIRERDQRFLLRNNKVVLVE